MRIKPTERKLVANLIEAAFNAADEEGEISIEDLADSILVSLAEKREGDTAYAAVIQTKFNEYAVYRGRGPFTTKRQAEVDLGKQVSPNADGDRAVVVQLQRDA